MTYKLDISHILQTLRVMSMVFLASAMSPMLTACDNDDNPWDNIPQNIAEFIEQYYPNFALESATDNDSGYHIRLKNGPGMTFNADGSWTDINGYGMPIVQVFLFDQLPPKLYNYLQETQQLNAVFSITRDNDYYTLDLLESSLRFDIANDTIIGSDATGGNGGSTSAKGN